jgi:hypothetical protein
MKSQEDQLARPKEEEMGIQDMLQEIWNQLAEMNARTHVLPSILRPGLETQGLSL